MVSDPPYCEDEYIMSDISAGEFRPFRSRDLEARLRHIEQHLVSSSIVGERDQALVNASGGTVVVVPGAGSGVIPEDQVDFDPSAGHDHDGVDSSTVPMTGDVSGTNTSVSVDKAKAVDLPTPASTDDWKLLSYLHSSVDYVLRHCPFPNRTETMDYTATLDDFVIFVDASGGNVTITLPTAASATQRGFFIKRIDASANTALVEGDGAETIDNAANYSLSSMESITPVSTGTAWYIV